MNNHLNDEQINGYVNRTLTDAHREAMDSHLLDCPDCRCNLTEHETIERNVRYALSTHLSGLSPSAEMSFTTISADLNHKSLFSGFWQPVLLSTTFITAAVGFLLSLIILPNTIIAIRSGSLLSKDHLPVLASACFGLTVLGNFSWKSELQTKKILSAMLAFILWLGTAIIGLQVIVTIRDLLVWFGAHTLESVLVASALGTWVLMPLGIMWIVLVVGGGEYHYNRFGQRSSWKLFGWTIAIELLVLLVYM